MLPGQIAAASYEAGRRQPGDYEAQVSQRPIAIHGLAHLGATDRGVTMFHNQSDAVCGPSEPGKTQLVCVAMPMGWSRHIVKIPLPACRYQGIR